MVISYAYRRKRYALILTSQSAQQQRFDYLFGAVFCNRLDRILDQRPNQQYRHILDKSQFGSATPILIWMWFSDSI